MKLRPGVATAVVPVAKCNEVLARVRDDVGPQVYDHPPRKLGADLDIQITSRWQNFAAIRTPHRRKNSTTYNY
jgi:hypothetical protein